MLQKLQQDRPFVAIQEPGYTLIEIDNDFGFKAKSRTKSLLELLCSCEGMKSILMVAIMTWIAIVTWMATLEIKRKDF